MTTETTIAAEIVAKPRKTAKPVAKKAKPVAAKIAKKTARNQTAGSAVSKPLSARAQIAADAANGKMPAKLFFTSPGDKRYQKKVDALNAAAEKRDIKALNAVEIMPYSSSPKRMIKWRELVITAIKASAATAKTAKAK